LKDLKRSIGEIDIYLIDQILKERYAKTDKILDVGCGSGRNIKWFYQHDYRVWGCDKNEEIILSVKNLYPNLARNFEVVEMSKLPYGDKSFDHIICSAVLHFAESTLHFKDMFSELIRVLKPCGSIFIRMASNIGIESCITHLEDGIFSLGDGTNRFLLTRELLQEIMSVHSLEFIEPLKTTNVNDLRCMSTLVLQNRKET